MNENPTTEAFSGTVADLQGQLMGMVDDNLDAIIALFVFIVVVRFVPTIWGWIDRRSKNKTMADG